VLRRRVELTRDDPNHTERHRETDAAARLAQRITIVGEPAANTAERTTGEERTGEERDRDGAACGATWVDRARRVSTAAHAARAAQTVAVAAAYLRRPPARSPRRREAFTAMSVAGRSPMQLADDGGEHQYCQAVVVFTGWRWRRWLRCLPRPRERQRASTIALAMASA
jgi:hypothetical protein